MGSLARSGATSYTHSTFFCLSYCKGGYKQTHLLPCREGFGPDDLRTVGMQSVIVDPNVTFTPEPNATPQAMFQYCEGEKGCTKVLPQVIVLSSAVSLFPNCLCLKHASWPSPA